VIALEQTVSTLGDHFERVDELPAVSALPSGTVPEEQRGDRELFGARTSTYLDLAALRWAESAFAGGSTRATRSSYLVAGVAAVGAGASAAATGLLVPAAGFVIPGLVAPVVTWWAARRKEAYDKPGPLPEPTVFPWAYSKGAESDSVDWLASAAITTCPHCDAELDGPWIAANFWTPASAQGARKMSKRVRCGHVRTPIGKSRVEGPVPAHRHPLSPGTSGVSLAS
jgi:hypothetical protein